MADTTIGGISGMADLTARSSKEIFGAQVVQKTLDTLNSGFGKGDSGNADYDFQKKVLAGGFAAKGALVDGEF